MVEIAAAEGVRDRYVGRWAPHAFLAPDIVASILSGKQPVEFNREALTKRVDLPSDWAAQRQLLGFAKILPGSTPVATKDRMRRAREG